VIIDKISNLEFGISDGSARRTLFLQLRT